MSEELKPENPCACTISLAEWIEQGDEDRCRSCLLAPISQWYRDELDEQGLADIAREVEEAAEHCSPAELCKKLDEIKARVPDATRERLREFDCEAQLYQLEENDAE